MKILMKLNLSIKIHKRRNFKPLLTGVWLIRNLFPDQGPRPVGLTNGAGRSRMEPPKIIKKEEKAEYRMENFKEYEYPLGRS